MGPPLSHSIESSSTLCISSITRLSAARTHDFSASEYFPMDDLVSLRMESRRCTVERPSFEVAASTAEIHSASGKAVEWESTGST